VHRLVQLARCCGNVLDDGDHVVAQDGRPEGEHTHNREQNDGGAQRPRQAQAREAGHHRRQRVGEENPEQEGDEDLGGLTQREDRREDGQDRERDGLEPDTRGAPAGGRVRCPERGSLGQVAVHRTLSAGASIAAASRAVTGRASLGSVPSKGAQCPSCLPAAGARRGVVAAGHDGHAMP